MKQNSDKTGKAAPVAAKPPKASLHPNYTVQPGDLELGTRGSVEERVGGGRPTHPSHALIRYMSSDGRASY